MRKDEIQKQANEWRKKPHLLHKIVNDAARITFNKSGVCCFTTDHENILMWSHYADSHKGICMKFDLLADPKVFFALFRVEYEKEYPKCNHLRDNARETVAKLVKTKAKVWEYEQEYRVPKYSDSGNHAFAPLALVEIIFGCRASEPFIHEIQHLTQSPRMSHVMFKKATVQNNNFGLDIKDL